MAVPFNRPTLSPSHQTRLNSVVESSKWAGDGAQTREASERLSNLHAGARVLLTTSCTAALEMSALLLNLEAGDEVIVPSYTFVSSANAFVLMGASVVFAEIDPFSLGVSMRTIRPLITDKTRAVVAVNYAGTPALSDADMRELKAEGIHVIEDNAHGLFGHHEDGPPLGVSSAISTLSFHETKNISCGEGGAIIINEQEFADRAEIIREKGTNRSRFFRGVVDKYTWIEKGSSYLPSEYLAAILNSQLDFAAEIQRRRRSACLYYAAELANTYLGEANQEVLLQHIREGSPHHMFYLFARDLTERSRLIDHLKYQGVTATFHYVPLHSSPGGIRFGRFQGNMNVTNGVADRLVRLPLFSDISEGEVEQVVAAVKSFQP